MTLCLQTMENKFEENEKEENSKQCSILRRLFSARKTRKENDDIGVGKQIPDEDMIRQLEIIQKRLYHDQMRMHKKSIERYNRIRAIQIHTEAETYS